MSRPTAGRLYCVPTPIAPGRAATDYLPEPMLSRLGQLDYVVAEQARTARAFLKQLPLTRPLQQIEVVELNEHTPASAIAALIDPVVHGRDAMLVSEAGAPGVADPGALLVRAAHEAGVVVEPVIGPSALLLALMGSGLDGQRFSFCGYLPVAPGERRAKVQALERRSRQERETLLFIETPYRNAAMVSTLLETLAPQTLLCLASGLTGESPVLATRTVAQWRSAPPNPGRQPTVYLLLARPDAR
jgi:16S rRNA (cytidine1402-2'-O)-methyltransferase